MVKVFFIIGCTACGKAAVGRELASRVGGQIISADSMKVYRRMDIGTAKPTAAQQAIAPHHCIDLVEPGEGFSAARYVACADEAIETIHSAGGVALAVGGTNLYIKALSEGLFEAPTGGGQIRQSIRKRADLIGPEALHAELARGDPRAAARIHRNDKRRVIRALEVLQTTGRPISELQRQWDNPVNPHWRYDCVFVGIRRDKADQSRRINARAVRMVHAGLRDEVAALLAEPAGLSDQASAAVGYAEIIAHLRDEMTLDEALEQIKIHTRRLAKKQRTWFRRRNNVRWFDAAEDETTEHLADRVTAEVKFEPA